MSKSIFTKLMVSATMVSFSAAIVHAQDARKPDRLYPPRKLKPPIQFKARPKQRRQGI